MNKKELAISGFNSVKSFCEHKQEGVLRLYFTKELSKQFGKICSYLASKKRFYKIVEDKDELERIASSTHHQGVVAIIREPVFPLVTESVIKQWAEMEKVVLFTDSVGNSQNLGAIIRSMAFFGIEDLVIPMNEKQSSITSATYRVAEGGMSFVSVYLTSSTKSFIDSVRGKMKIITADVNSHHDIKKMDSFVEANTSVLLVLGNEVEGVGEYIRKRSDHSIKIKGVGNIESLNVAQTATIFLQKIKEIKCNVIG